MKSILTLVLVLVTTLALAQYPTTKVVDGQEVVIMTVKQADEINDLFLLYTDSLKNLNLKIGYLQKSLDFSQKQIEALDGTLAETKAAIAIRDSSIVYYKGEMKRIDKLEWIDKKTRVRVGIGLGTVLLTWATLFIFSK